jgi:coenzyme Q-binding protein COQ10
MTTHRASRFLPAPRDDVFTLVADVERYPEFLTLWRRARIDHRAGEVYWTDQDIGLGPIHERFRTRTELNRPDWIEVTSDDPLFRTFLIRWDFVDVRSGCQATVSLTWDMRSFRLRKAIDLLLPTVARKMVDAFEGRLASKPR